MPSSDPFITLIKGLLHLAVASCSTYSREGGDEMLLRLRPYDGTHSSSSKEARSLDVLVTLETHACVGEGAQRDSLEGCASECQWQNL